ncbi:hypothetical protein [Bradyrhizobium sp.]|uniref:hypothetical protein n=1 Tax=Bradyrhizobium sp. TaxID=376 RepID=UPI00239B54C3|nr:hypothetical protein [Bradyrhizobium sp.]
MQRLTWSKLMTAANVVLLYAPSLPIRSSLAIAFAARHGALYFTKWYPAQCRIKYGAPAGALPQSR